MKPLLIDTSSPTKAHIRHHAPAYRPDIDGLRAVAVIGVLLFHAFPAILRGGFVGVDVFFVISGYLITRTIIDDLDRGAFSIAGFYSRRVRRIFPALLAVLGACFVFGWNTMLAEDLSHLAKQTVGGSTFIANILLWHDAGYFDQASATKPLLHLWSLGIEEQFYVIWPLLLALAWRLRLPLMPIVVATAVASFTFNLSVLHTDPTQAFYSPLSRAWELMVGGFIAHWHSEAGAKERLSWRRLAERRGWDVSAPTSARLAGYTTGLGVILILYAMVRVHEHLPFPGKWALLPTVGAACIIGGGLASKSARAILSVKPLVWIGLISYPLYLWHWPLLVLGRSVAERDLTGIERAGVIVVSVILAWATWRFIERPMRTKGFSRWKVGSLSAGMAIVAIIAGVSVWTDGAPSRYPPIIQRSTEYDLKGYRSALRDHICFMEMGETSPTWRRDCIDPGARPLWIVWGDSAAAAMIPGLRELSDTSGRFRLGQFTSSACPPMVGFKSNNSTCAQNNQIVLSTLEDMKPDTVLLGAMWHEYDKASLQITIEQLKAKGVRRIVVLGPPPSWADVPSRIVFNSWKSDPMHAAPKIRLDYEKHGMGQRGLIKGLDFRTSTAETILRGITSRTDAQYVSLTEALCNNDGCQVATSEETGEPLYLDEVHLNPTGSKLAVSLIKTQLE